MKDCTHTLQGNDCSVVCTSQLQSALMLHQQGHLDEAEALYKTILLAQPHHFDALQLSATIAAQRNRFLDAVELFVRVLEINPNHANSLNNYGNALRGLHRYEEALLSYEKAIAVQPDYADAYNNRGIALMGLHRYEEALLSYEKAIAVQPDYAGAYHNRGMAFMELGRDEDAVLSYTKAIAVKPDYAEAYHNRCNVLMGLRRIEEALVSYDELMALIPDDADVYYNRALLFYELKRYEEAVSSYNKAIALKPDGAESYVNRGVALADLKRYEEAVLSYERAFVLKSDYDFLSGLYLHTKMKIGDWDRFGHLVHQLVLKIENQEKVSLPFPVLAIEDSLFLQQEVAKIYVSAIHPRCTQLPVISLYPRHDKIRIGYYSADFHDHATAYLMAGLFEKHDRSRFEIIAFSFGPDKCDGMRKRVASAFDRFIDVRSLSDRDVALLSRNLGVDLAVDLKGFTQHSRTGIFALRAAPIQVSYLGYPGTMGAEYIDYLIADETLIPERSRFGYTEKIVYLPDSYQVNDTERVIADRVFTREELGLPANGFVFCCFNNNFKITPTIFDCWMRILRQVEGSVLWLFEDNLQVADNLRREAVQRGIESSRLVFAKRMPLAEHLARHRSADLFLDTLPYNAHTTASDALWAGLPLLTLQGESFASRVAASLLNAMQLPELITSNWEEYEALAIELATNSEKLGKIRQKVEQNRLTTPLFDTKRFTQHLEKAYSMMYERYQEGLAPDHLILEPFSVSAVSDPDYYEVLNSRGMALQRLMRYEDALLSYDQAIALKPTFAEAYCNRGIALKKLRRYKESLVSYDTCLSFKPDLAEAFYNRGIVLCELKRYEEALASYEKAIALKPKFPEAFYNRGNVLLQLKRNDEALASYDRALVLRPGYDFLSGVRMHTSMKICDWKDFGQQINQLEEKIERHEKVSSPFPLLAITDSLFLQKEAARVFVQNTYPPNDALPAILKRERHDKIRIGYYSADFHDHATAYLMAGLFEKHDRSRFEIIAFSFGPDKCDGMRKRVASAFDRFIDVRSLSDRDVALLSRNLGVDLAVDLKGFTQHSRTGIFALRAAPIQVSYLGYPGTMGAEYIDYLIADKTLIPERSRCGYTEKIVYLPDSYQVNDTTRALADRVFTRKELGLPETGFVFCCFNNNFKITPTIFDCWMRILRQVEGSVLWLFEDNLQVADNLRQEAVQRGIESSRLVFAKRMPLAEHLARHRSADLFLDTLPCNAHTTASDALWAGLPLLTLAGESFAGRVAASLLHAMQLPELITSTREEYEALAIGLASNPEKLAKIRYKVEQNRLTTPLFDTKRFTQQLEKAYSMMYERYQEGLKPDHIVSLSIADVGKESPKIDLQASQSGQVQSVPVFVQTASLSRDELVTCLHSALALHQAGRIDEAEALYSRILCVQPEHVDALQLLAVITAQKKNYKKAVALFDKVLTIDPDHASTLNNRGIALKELMRYEEAVLSYDRALALKPDYADAYHNRGVALKELKRYEEALLSYDRALAVRPDFADTYSNRGNVLLELLRYDEAVLSYEKAFALKPDHDFLSGLYLHIRMKICDWRAFDLHIQQLAEKVERHEKVSSPFPVLAISDSLSLQKEAARIFIENTYPPNDALTAILKRERHDKMRIGYYSADFHDHATAYLMAGLFEKHDRSRFEIIAFSFGPDKCDGMRKRVAAAFDRFIDARSLSDRDVALLSRDLAIDIAVDLKGFTKHSRTGIFALRAAPIQVSYLGYPGTMGAEYIDYLIADETLISEGSRCGYTEKIVYLPDSYQVNDTERVIADRVFTREELGLPANGFVFCCFNNNFKITPTIFDCWMRILRQVEGSVLWLFEDNLQVADNLRREAVQRGIESSRLVFAQRMPLAEHLARHRSADLFLDTLPCNAHTTASDALWAGLPLLTLTGESFASRVAASLLNAIHLSELITSTQEEYEALAIELATNPEKLGKIRQKLAQNRFTTPLFDTKRFTRNLEQVYCMMYERSQQELPPAHLFSLPSAQGGTGTIQPLQQEYACCPLCGGKSALRCRADCSRHSLWHEPLPRILEWMRCTNCHHVYTRHFWTQAGIDELFRNAHQNQLAGFGASQDAKRANWVPVVDKVLNLLGGYRSIMDNGSHPTWVDVGCGDGALAMTASDYGFSALGLDARSEAVRRIIELGFKAQESDFMQCTFEHKLDVLSMMDVLEHMPYPGLALGKAAELVRPGGILVISLPDLSCSSWRMMDAAKSNPYWMEIEHHHNFSRERLIALLGERGFGVADFGIPHRYKAQMELYAVRKNLFM